MKRGKYRLNKLSISKRSEWLEFYNKMYSNRDKRNVSKLTPKNKVSKPETALVYTDAIGAEIQLPASDITNFEDTAWFKISGSLFPQISEDRQAFFGTAGNIYDEAGRPSLTDVNLIVLEVKQMTVGEYGPYYGMHVLAAGEGSFSGEFSVLTRGQVVAEAIQEVSGIDLESGKQIAPGELPVALRVSYVAGKGQGEGYYYVVAPVREADATPV